MSKDISIQNGANLNLKGLASKEFEVANKSLTYALNPDDFFSLVPRMLVKEGAFIKKGDPVFFDKNDENIKIVSPVSGKIKQIVRGEKRKILNVIIERSGDDVRNFDIPDLKSIPHESIIKLLINSGTLAYIRQRPYNIIARPNRLPKSIFVSSYSTAPYAADYEFLMSDRLNDLQVGINVLGKIINKPINFCVSSTKESIFTQLKNVELYIIKRNHPAGNESFQLIELIL
jgi:Na+-transporting NADH:ubiquinone oxidoreductase, subunit NqrA